MTDEERERTTVEGQAVAAYHAYGDSVGWKNFADSPMPQWTELPERIRMAWRAAADAAGMVRLLRDTERKAPVVRVPETEETKRLFAAAKAMPSSVFVSPTPLGPSEEVAPLVRYLRAERDALNAEVERMREDALHQFAELQVRSLQAVESEREACARLAEAEAERLKHTSHVDGLGMGFQAGETLATAIAAAIRARGESRGHTQTPPKLDGDTDTCALCGNPAEGFAVSGHARLCHTDKRDCYRRWTVYGERQDARGKATPEPQGDPKRGAEHGWVTESLSGAKARCGGPGLCRHCRAYADELRARGKGDKA